PEPHARLVAVEEGREYAKWQRGGHEQRSALERGYDDVARLARLGRRLVHLPVVLDPGGQVPGRLAAVHPFGVVQQSAAVRDLAGGQDLGNMEEHRLLE